jgi:transposase-like protein
MALDQSFPSEPCEAFRTTARNGHRAWVPSTKANDVDLAIRKLRMGSFSPTILEPRRRIDQALRAVFMEASSTGNPPRAGDGRVPTIARCFQVVAHQRCRFHFARTLRAMIPNGHQVMMAAAFETVFTQVSGVDMHTQWDQITATLGDRLQKAAAFVVGVKVEFLALTNSPSQHWGRELVDHPT